MRVAAYVALMIVALICVANAYVSLTGHAWSDTFFWAAGAGLFSWSAPHVFEGAS